MDEPQHTVDNCATGPAARRPGTGELAESRLRRSAYLALRPLSCEFRAGVLTLRGRLPSYYLKQVAQAAVATVEGVERIDNQIEVAAHPASPASGEPRLARRPQPGGPEASPLFEP
jgi:osmotically-inducible protein OsmY